ncbi:unnamed protein product [Closterium sp. Yama58-4]|nr:unnamed protein product [Closterium sp. Yama58-4]
MARPVLGICRFTGTRVEVPAGRQRKVKYLLLQFADGSAKLSAKQAKQVLYRFGIAGPPGRSPPLSKMNDTSLWERRQAKGKEAVERMVGEMMDVYVKRLRQRRPVYPKFDAEMQRFGESFAYKPTPDQEQAFLDVERDMCERETSMDRLVCGDAVPTSFPHSPTSLPTTPQAFLDVERDMCERETSMDRLVCGDAVPTSFPHSPTSLPTTPQAFLDVERDMCERETSMDRLVCGDAVPTSFPHSPTSLPTTPQAFLDVERDMCERETPMDRLVCGEAVPTSFPRSSTSLPTTQQAFLDVEGHVCYMCESPNHSAGQAALQGHVCSPQGLEYALRRHKPNNRSAPPTLLSLHPLLQAMVLAPTTVLAKQHFKVMSTPLKDYGVYAMVLAPTAVLAKQHYKVISARLKDCQVFQQGISRSTFLPSSSLLPPLFSPPFSPLRQAMVLAPTTVLAKQHFKVISARLKDYGVRVALLSRFQKESEKKEVLAGIRDGTLDVVAGTHSLLGAQVVYHNLGLLVIDEEQRFGVRQKERISSLKTSVDVLTLSATPIPRTLYMSMHGFRDASRITTPPPERQPIDTHLLEFDVENVKRAIGDELERGGQVFYVVPRVEGIEEIQMLLEELFPSARVDVAHGKLRPTDLEAVMERFGEGEIDVLVCTSIIESGIDIRTVNTIVIEDTHLFGLAQIYQLRGRVGRSSSSAHAYLFHPPLHCLTPEAQERLRALQQHSGLGEGYLLAQRDMDIRGIGDVFGERQSGDVGGVGYYLFMEMLHETLTRVEQKSLPRVQFKEVRLDLPLDPLPPIPASYVPDAAVRARLPREAEEAAAEGMAALLAFCKEMRAEYGDEPAAVELLFKHLFVRRMAADLGIYRILQREQGTTIVMETAMKLPAFEILRDAVQQKAMRESLSFRSGRIELQGTKLLSAERVLERALTCLAQMRNALPSFVNFL